MRSTMLGWVTALWLAAGCSGGGGPGVPGPPRLVSASPGNGRAFIGWLPPESDGGSPVLRYVVSAPGRADAEVAAPTTRLEVTGLSNGIAYAFSVRAANAEGDGPAVDAPVVTPAQGGAASTWVAGYYVGYQRDLYPEASVDLSGMTHLAVGRIRPRLGGGLYTDFDVDPVQGPAMARTLSARAHAAGKKAILMLGGDGEHDRFVDAASPANRATFVAALLRALDDLGYDGLDVDWEPILAADRPNLLALLEDLRAARPGILLSVPVGWTNANFPGEIDAWYAELALRVDRVNAMTYDMASSYWGGWDSWHFAALDDHAGTHPSSIRSTVEAYLAAGVPPGKLGIGIGFYGACWRGVREPRVPLDGLDGVSMGNSDNAMSYDIIQREYFQPSAYRWDAAASAPYLTFASPTGGQRCDLVTYEDPLSIAAKGRFVRERGLGGAVLWTIAQGHLTGPGITQRDPLLDAVRAAFLE